MAKGQKHGNREPKKPKQPKKTQIATLAVGTGRSESVQATFNTRRNGAKPHS